jgi:hypothetical protein
MHKWSGWFAGYLTFYIPVNCSEYLASNDRLREKSSHSVILMWFVTNLSRHTLRQYPVIRLEGVNKTAKSLSQVNR